MKGHAKLAFSLLYTLGKAAGVILIVLLFATGILKQCKVQKRFGFRVSTPKLGRFTNHCEVILVYSVDSGGAFYNAGIRPADILIDTTNQWLQNYLWSFNKESGEVVNIQTIPKGYGANDCLELGKMPPKERKVIAP